MKRLFIVCMMLVGLPLSSRPALAQVPKDGRLLITVTDPTGAVVQGASVSVVGLDPSTKAAEPAPVKTNDKGVATIDGVLLGRYAIQAEFPGFQLGLVADVRVKSGDNKHVVVLPLKKMEESVTVERDKQQSAMERGTTFGTALTREQIDALSDDPAEMERQLKDMAGPDAVIRVDSFEGQQLPPKAQIKSIHITRDQFAAENHSAGGIFVDIITQPGIGKLRTNTGMNFYDSSMDGKNPLVQARGPARNQSYRGSLGGTLIKNKADFSIALNGSSNYATPTLNASTATGLQARNLTDFRQPSDNVGMSGLLNYAITKDQTLRVGFNGGKSSTANQGIGQLDLAERAYSTDNSNFSFRAQEAGPLGRRFFTNTRFTLFGSNATAHSAVEAPTITVPDSFTSGGAQRAGGTHTKNFTLASDLDYVRGKHSVRAGLQLDGIHYRTDSSSNYLGTYTFANLDALAAGTPENFTRRLGDPNIKYWQVQAGAYLQDDIRLKKSLTLSTGVRYEAQAHLKDYQNIGPRVGLTWAPFKSGKTTLRASWGVFYDWLSSNTYGQTLLFDGSHQEEVNIVNPAYPDPGSLTGLPSNRYLLGPNLQMVRNMRGSAGFSQTINSMFSVGATFSDVHANGLLVGDNLNTPIDGVRPDAAFANVIETVADGRSRAKTLSAFTSINLAKSNSGPGGPVMVMNGMMMAMGGGPSAPPAAKLFDWRRGLGIFVNYTLAKSENNTDGAFAVPASGNLAAEWGPSAFDIRHRANISINTGALKNFNASIGISANSAAPLNIRTGFDDNGDGIFNDRPVDVGRNSARAGAYWNTYGFFSYSIGFGKGTGSAPPGIMITSMGVGGPTVQSMGATAQPRYRLNLNVSVNNLTNHAVLTNYIGTVTSALFLKPTSASGVRSVNFSMGLSF